MNQLATLPQAHPAAQLTAAQVRLVHDQIAAVVSAADTAIETLRVIGGPDPGHFASALRTKLNMGAGYFRSSAADIEDAWRKANVRARIEQQQQDP